MKKVTILSLSIIFLLSFGAFHQVQAAGQYNQATITWQLQPNTKCYQIYYKESQAKNWQNAVGCKDLSTSTWRYTIKYLKTNTSYTYNVAAISYTNKQTFFGDKTMVVSPMQ